MIKALFFNLFVRKFLLYSFGLVALVFSIVGIDLATYQQLTKKDSIYRISIYEVSPNKFDFHLQSNGDDQVFQLEGDQWQIDFRLIRFTAASTLAGLSNLYQPSRLSNRYEFIEDQRSKSKQYYSLRDPVVNGLDLWKFIKKYSAYFPGVDSAFGSSVYAPLKHNAEYEILIGYAGIVVKALNEEGQSAIQQWL